MSKGRPENVALVERLLATTRKGGAGSPQVAWFVGEGERQAYEAAGATDVRESGGLCASRNAALVAAQAAKKFCVQMSDDIHAFTFSHQAKVWVQEEKSCAKQSARRA